MKHNTSSRRGFFAKTLAWLGGFGVLSKAKARAAVCETISAATTLSVPIDWQPKRYEYDNTGHLTVHTDPIDYHCNSQGESVPDDASYYAVYYPCEGRYQVYQCFD